MFEIHNKKGSEGASSIKQIYLPIENHPRRGVLWTPAGERSSLLRQKDREFHVLCPFSHAFCLARYSVLYLLGVLSGGDKPSPVGEGGSRRLTDEELVWRFLTPHPPLSRSPLPYWGRLFVNRKSVCFSWQALLLWTQKPSHANQAMFILPSFEFFVSNSRMIDCLKAP